MGRHIYLVTAEYGMEVRPEFAALGGIQEHEDRFVLPMGTCQVLVSDHGQGEVLAAKTGRHKVIRKVKASEGNDFFVVVLSLSCEKREKRGPQPVSRIRMTSHER